MKHDRTAVVGDVAHDDLQAIALTVDLDVGGDSAVEGNGVADIGDDAGPGSDERPEGTSRRTDERVLGLRTGDVGLRRATRVAPLEREQRARSGQCPGEGKRVA